MVRREGWGSEGGLSLMPKLGPITVPHSSIIFIYNSKRKISSCSVFT